MSNEQQRQEEELGFSLNNKEYRYADLSDEQKDLVVQLKDIQMQLDRIEFQHRQVSGSKQHFTELLTKSVESDSEEPKSE